MASSVINQIGHIATKLNEYPQYKESDNIMSLLNQISKIYALGKRTLKFSGKITEVQVQSDILKLFIRWLVMCEETKEQLMQLDDYKSFMGADHVVIDVLSKLSSVDIYYTPVGQTPTKLNTQSVGIICSDAIREINELQHKKSNQCTKEYSKYVNDVAIPQSIYQTYYKLHKILIDNYDVVIRQQWLLLQSKSTLDLLA